MIPSSVILIPLFIILGKLKLLDSLFTIMITSLSIPMMVYLFRQSTKMFPIELIKAARIDGVGDISAFWKIYLPNMMPSFVTAGVLLFIETWNGFLFPLIIVQTPQNMVLSLYMNSYGTSYTTDYGAFMVLRRISTIPTIIVFAVTRKYFLAGLNATL